MGKLINQDEAIDYRQSISDPIVRAMVTHGHRLAMLHMDRLGCDGHFDILFLTKLLEIFFNDRERVARELLGDFDEDEFDLSPS